MLAIKIFVGLITISFFNGFFMPFTLFHFGPALFFGVLFFRKIYLPAFVAGNVIVDLEPLAVLLFGLDYPLHGFFHSFAGGILAGGILAAGIFFLDGKIQKLMNFFDLKQNFSNTTVLLSSIFGVWVHILFDSTLYTDINPFFPLDINPFFVGFEAIGPEIYLLCVALGALGVGLYFYKIRFFQA